MAMKFETSISTWKLRTITFFIWKRHFEFGNIISFQVNNSDVSKFEVSCVSNLIIVFPVKFVSKLCFEVNYYQIELYFRWLKNPIIKISISHQIIISIIIFLIIWNKSSLRLFFHFWFVREKFKSNQFLNFSEHVLIGLTDNVLELYLTVLFLKTSDR